MPIIPPISHALLGYAATFFCIGLGMLFLRKAAKGETGPEYWAASFFLNSAGFVFWALKGITGHFYYFIGGDFIHMLGFITLVYGTCHFTEKSFQKKHVYSVLGLGAGWILAIVLWQHFIIFSYFLLMSLRAVLFLWTGRMILTIIPENSNVGRKLTGWALVAWGVYVLLFPLISLNQSLVPFALGFLTGFHVLAGMGMVILVVDKIRVRAEKSDTQRKYLEGLIPICSKCKKIRDDHDSWQILETYLQQHSDALFSHGICPDCSESLYGNQDWYQQMKKGNGC